jgi:N-formylglutamate deformylase
MRPFVPVIHGSVDWITLEACSLATPKPAMLPHQQPGHLSERSRVLAERLNHATTEMQNGTAARHRPVVAGDRTSTEEAHVAVYLQPVVPSSGVKQRARVPLLLDSPHSGRIYPADFEFYPDFTRLRRGEDAYVDRLIAPALHCGATVVAALFPRTYIDVNRHENDIDVELLASPWPYPVRPSEKTARGLGLLRRYVVPGEPVYAPGTRLSVEQVHHRIVSYYEPYLTLIANAIDILHSEFGVVYHLDVHSMKSRGNAMTPDGAGTLRPDVVVGDLRGSACEPDFTQFVVRALEEEGLSVSVNKPYAGAGILRRFSAPMDGVHCLQIELNRALYLDEDKVECYQDGRFERLQGALARVFARVAAWTLERAASTMAEPVSEISQKAQLVDRVLPSVARRLRSSGMRVSASLLEPLLLGDADGGHESDPDSNDDPDDDFGSEPEFTESLSFTGEFRSPS